ncbi:unnamed protein product, partial [Vitis vinifera]
MAIRLLESLAENPGGVLNYQNIQQKIQEYLHQFFTPSILLPIQNNPAVSVTFSYKHVFDCI